MSRTRSRTLESTIHSADYRYEVYHTPCGEPTEAPVVFSGSMDGVGRLVNESMIDVVQPDFKRRIAEGEIINNPLQKTLNTLTVPEPPGFYYAFSKGCTDPSETREYAVYGTGSPTLEYLAYGIPESLSSLRASVIDEAVTNAHANIDASQMLALVTIGESKKSIVSTLQILKRVFRIYSALRKGNFKRLKREISESELEDRYMEARYALRPLMYDAVGIYKGLTAPRDDYRQTFRGHASGEDSGDSVVINSVERLHSLRMDCRNEWSYNVTARAGVLCDVSISELNIWGFDKIAESAWELVPFSFIVDWFIQFGNLIAAHTPDAGVKQRASWVTVKETFVNQNVYHNPHIITSWDNWTASCDDYVHQWKSIATERIVNPVQSALPSVNIRLDDWKIQDLCIILSRMISGKADSNLRI